MIERRVSEGDRRRRYISLCRERLDGLVGPHPIAPKVVLFVCTHNSARSRFAAARWRQVSGLAAQSAGTAPADRVHPGAVRAASRFDVDLGRDRPKGYDAVTGVPDLVVSVCDRARESGLPFSSPSLHWSVPDLVRTGTPAAFRSAFAVAVADTADAATERVVRHVDTGRLPADRLHDECEDLFEADAEDRLLEGADAGGGGRLRALRPEREWCRDLVRWHRQRSLQP